MIVIVIISLILIGLLIGYYIYVKQNDLKYKNEKFTKQSEESKRVYTGSCGPGCQFECDNKDCPNMKLKGNKTKHTLPKGQMYSSKPNLTKNLPLGYVPSKVAYTGISDCSGNINGVMKSKNENPYGKVYPEGDQMYSFCDKGANNPFN